MEFPVVDSSRWAIEVASITVNGVEFCKNNTDGAGFENYIAGVDTASSHMRVPTEIVDAIVAAIQKKGFHATLVDPVVSQHIHCRYVSDISRN